MRSRLSNPVPRSYSHATCDFSSDFLSLLKKDLSTHRKEELINKNYAYDLQLATYSDFSSLTALPSLFRILPFDAIVGNQQNSGKKIVMFFGYAVPVEGGLMEKTYLDFIRKMDPIVEGGYYMVFFNTGISSFEQRHFTFLRNCYQRLPMKYLLGLEQIFIVSPTLLLKSILLLSSGFANKVIEQKTIYVNNLKELRDYPIFPLEIKKFVPDFISKEDESISKRTGGIGKSLSHCNLEENGLPEVLVFLVSYFEVSPENFQVQGIFRLATDLKEISKLEKELNEGNYEHVFEIADVHIICNMIKKFFTAMAEPLFGFENYSVMWEIANLSSKEDKLEKLRELISSLPRLNLKTFQFFLSFLKKIESYRDTNLMNSNNLAIVFMPCFLRPVQYSGEDLKKTPKLVELIKLLLDNPGLLPPPLLRRTSAPLSRDLLGQKDVKLEKGEWNMTEEEQGKKSDENSSKIQSSEGIENDMEIWGGVLKVVRRGGGGGGIGRAESMNEGVFKAILTKEKPEEAETKKKGLWGKIKGIFN
jgi:hypothetical protein